MSTALVLGGCLVALALLAVWAERRSNAREMALIVGLGTVAAAGRVLFAAVPSATPVTVICLVAGAQLGARAGALVGALAALASNTLLGHGPWTLAQMALWAAVGVSGALLRHVVRHRWGLVALGVAWGFLFGWAMNIWFLATFGPELSMDALLVTGLRSLPFDLTGALANGLIALVAGPALLRLTGRAAQRLRVVRGGGLARELPSPLDQSPQAPVDSLAGRL